MEETWEFAAVSDPQDEIKVSASDKGVALKAKGSAASRLGHTIVDLLSPFSGFAGVIGDEFNYIRSKRQDSVKAGLIRAQEIREEEKLENGEVSPKLLNHWIEGVSSEDLEGENIIDMWARILANCPSDFDSGYAAAIEIAKRIGPIESEFLRRLRISLDKDPYRANSVDMEVFNSNAIYDHVSHNLIFFTEASSTKEYDKRLKDFAENIPHLTVGLIYKQRIYEPKGRKHLNFLADKKMIAANVLVREGILEFKEVTKSNGVFTLKVSYLEITDFGSHLLQLIFPKMVKLPREYAMLQKWALE